MRKAKLWLSHFCALSFAALGPIQEHHTSYKEHAMGRLILMRHGRTYANAAKVFDTKPPGAPLTILGRVQVAATGRQLHAEGFQLVKIYHSIAVRAQQSAQIAAQAYGDLAGCSVEVQPIEGIHEMFGGDFEGSGGRESKRAYYRALAQWMRGNYEASMPGGESANEVIRRATPALEHAADLARTTDGDVLMVSHGAAMRIMGHFASDIDDETAHETYINNAAFCVFEPVGPIGSWHASRWVDVER